MSKCTKHVLDVKGIEKLKIEDETKIKGSTKKGEMPWKDKGKVIEDDSKEPRREPKPQRSLGQFCELDGIQAPRHPGECGDLVLSQL